MHNKDLSVFMQTIGYDFKDISLLEVALTHSSYANEQKKGMCVDNERMEFLGDAVLELSSSDYIYKNHSEMAEGKMTRLRASIVCEPTLALCARAIKLDTFIRLGKGEELTGGRSRDSIVSDACEAVIGAIYLDGGFANAKEFVNKFILNDLDNKKLFFDSKTILQEVIQGLGKEVDYELAKAIEDETRRQQEHIELIASENYVSKAVLEAQGSIMTNKYAEGYPGQREEDPGQGEQGESGFAEITTEGKELVIE